MASSHQLATYNYQDYIPSEGISCPICDLACASSHILNLHLDSAHTEEDTKGALMTWFRNTQKKVQTSFVNTSRFGSSPSIGSSDRLVKQWVDPSLLTNFQNITLSNNPVFFVSDQDKQGDIVTREHWQRESGNDKCNISSCNKIVGKAGAGKQHCRKCGKLYCDNHTQFEMKLDRQAKHDPESGVWCKVCASCYVNRAGYMDHRGVTRNRTDEFLKLRSKTIDRVYLESNRLEKRLEKLARVHQMADSFKVGPDRFGSPGISSPSSNNFSPNYSESASSRDSLTSMLSSKSSLISNHNSILSLKLKYRDGEQSITKWEDDKSVTECPFCKSHFSLINRKHHCRLCGRVVCGNPKCSKMVPLFTDMSSDSFDDIPVGDTRACQQCQRSVFRRKLRNEESSKPLPIIQLYNQLSITRRNIERLLPKFHDTVFMLEYSRDDPMQNNIKSQSHDSYVQAAKIRKTLLDNFTLYDTLAKSIRSLPVRSPSMKRLQSNICNAASLYLQQNMLPLQMLPRILQSEKTKQSQKKTETQGDIETQLQAYMEQYTLVEGFIKKAQSERKYDDVKILKSSLDDLRDEIGRLRNRMT
ncbi:FYVE zinc finger-domain-containing protein [Pilobolus umbonatus]|nr:FYVE zinc finger-domain-containing protein [Pilobolus umbonatus]